MTDFRIEVIIDPAQARTGARAVRGELASTEAAGAKLQRTLTRAFQLVGTSIILRELQQIADGYTNAQNRLRTVIDSEQELTQVTQELFEVAERTRSSFTSSAELYARLSLATKDLALSQQEVLEITQSMNQAIILSGASAQEAEAGLIQLSQGLASGALRGDELRSVLEQLPAVADVIAKSLGITRGQLRSFGQEGKITAEVIINAFQEAREELNDKFAKSVPTIGQSFVVLRNATVQFVGEFDKATGISRTLSSAIIDLANNLEDLVSVAAGAGAIFAAIKFAPTAQSVALLAQNFIKTRLAIAQGTAVALGSAEATRLQAAAAVEAAAAEAQKTQAVIAGIEADRVRTASSTQSLAVSVSQAEAEVVLAAARTRAAQVTLAKAEAEHALSVAITFNAEQNAAILASEAQLATTRAASIAATEALTAAQAQLAIATETTTLAEAAQRASETQLAALKATLATQTATLANAQKALGVATAATTLRFQLFTRAFAVNPFVLLTAGAVGAFFVLKKLREELDEIQEIRVQADAGEFTALTEFGKLGEEIIKVNAEIDRYQENIRASRESGDLVNPVSVRLLADAQGRLSELSKQQDILRARTDKAKAALREQNEAAAELESSFRKSIDALNTDARLLQLDNREREIQSELLKTIAQIEKKDKAELTGAQKEELENLVRRNATLREQAGILESLQSPQQKYQDQFDALSKLLHAGVIDHQKFNEQLVKFAAEAKGLDLGGATFTLPDPQGFDDIVSRLTLLIEGQKKLADQESLRTQILNELNGPQQEFADRQTVLNRLLNLGQITQEQYNRALDAAKESIRAANPEYAAQRDLLQEIRGPAADLEKRLQSLAGLFANGAIGVATYAAEVAKTENELRRLNPEFAETQDLLNRIIGPSKELEQTQQRLTLLFLTGAINASQYAVEMQKVEDAIVALNPQTQLQSDLLNALHGPQEQFLATQSALNALLDSGKISVEEYAFALNNATIAANSLGLTISGGVKSGLAQIQNDLLDVGGTVQETIVGGFQAGKEALVDFVRTGELDVSHFFDVILDGLAELLVQQLLLGIGGTGFGSFLSGIFGGFRAGGGETEENKSYVVGEEGPEIFTPEDAGTVTPAGETAAILGGAGQQPVINVTAPPAAVQVVNVRDASEIPKGIQSSEGTQAVLNVIHSNRRSIREDLG